MFTKLFNRSAPPAAAESRRGIVRSFGFDEEGARIASFAWLQDGYTVRLLRAADGSWTLEAWEG